MDPSPQGPCVVTAVNKFTQTTEVLWKKRDSMATLWVRERAMTPACTGFYCFSGNITLRMVLIYYRFALGGYLLQKTKERVLLIISKKKDICKCKGKVVELFTLILGRFSIDFRKLL